MLLQSTTSLVSAFEVILLSTLLTTVTIGGMHIKLRCNDYIEKVYVQDKEQSGRRDWREIVSLPVSDEASIIAVQWSNVGGTTPALIASASTGIVSDDINWKCTTTQPEANWFEEHFNSRGWENAALVCRNDNCGSRSDFNFPGNASWIRSTGGSLAGRTYCRGQLGPVSLTVVTPKTEFTYPHYDDGVSLGILDLNKVSVTKVLTTTPKLIAIRSKRRNEGRGWILVSLTNGCISGTDWKCKADDGKPQGWKQISFDDTSWDPAVLVSPTTNDYKVIDNNAGIWYTSENDEGETNCYCRGTLGVSAYVYCNDRGHVYVDGVKMNKRLINNEWRSIIPRTARLIAIEAENTSDRRLIRATFSNGFQTSESWKCSTVHHDNWNTIQFDDSTDDWKGSLLIASNPHNYIWDESNKEGTIYCRGWIECGCGPNYQCIPSLDGYNYKCVCREGYSGEKCEDAVPAVKCSGRSAVCGDHGRCVDIDDIYVCLCDDGYAGDTCNRDINECASNPCHHGTSCINTDGDFHCNCADSGYEGKICNKDVDECSRKLHKCVHGTCSNLFGSYWCTCESGYAGLHCETDIDECADRAKHGCNGLCSNLPGGYVCGCEAGFELHGKYDCVDINECTSNPCHHGTSCINTDGDFHCNCADSGYEGKICDKDIDECADRANHGCNGLCSNLPGGYVCGCEAGFELHGKYDCVDINECDRETDNCDHSCTNTDGSFKCSCKDGYELMSDGHSCEDIDECEEDTQRCDESERCRNLVASFTCVCKEGYESVNGDVPCAKITENGASVVGLSVGISVAVLILIAVGLAAFIIFYRKRKCRTNKNEETVNERSNRSTRESGYSTTEMSRWVHATGTATGHEYEQLRNLNEVESQLEENCTPEAAASEVSTDAAGKNETLIYSNVDVEAQVSKPIRVGDMSVYVKTKLEEGAFTSEFKSIPMGKRGVCSAAEREGIRHKLRFKDIVPYDYNRVVLSKVQGQPLSDFANASYVDGYRKPKYYIATQGPQKEILDEFWRMVWEQNVSLIVMVTNFVEAGEDKCDQYWPDDCTNTYKEFTVTIQAKQEMMDFIFRTFCLEQNGERRLVKQCHFTAWPDKGVPRTGASLLEFRRHVQKIVQNCRPPVVVHSSAGVGRTGTYIALDYLLHQAQAEGVVDICGCVNLLRESRMQMVQTLDQYTFLHSVLMEAFTVGRTTISCSDFMQRYGILRKVHPTTKMSKLRSQYQLLETLKPSYDKVDYSESLSEVSNAAKNRDATILPVNQYRPYLRATPGISSDYINAVFVDGYYSQREFLVTQMPLKETVVDVWRLVADFGIRTIVQLHEESEVPFIPEGDHATLDTEVFSIGNISTKTEDQMILRALLVSGSNLQKERRVHHISLTGWPNEEVLPKNPDLLLAAIRSMLKQQRQQGALKTPVLIVCLDGANRSGLFCAVSVMMERINAHQEVDIFNAVRNVRQSRPQFISTQKQYEYLHEVAKTYLSGFDLYDNLK